jgi:hypothetical protein
MTGSSAKPSRRTGWAPSSPGSTLTQPNRTKNPPQAQTNAATRGSWAARTIVRVAPADAPKAPIRFGFTASPRFVRCLIAAWRSRNRSAISKCWRGLPALWPRLRASSANVTAGGGQPVRITGNNALVADCGRSGRAQHHRRGRKRSVLGNAQRAGSRSAQRAGGRRRRRRARPRVKSPVRGAGRRPVRR